MTSGHTMVWPPNNSETLTRWARAKSERASPAGLAHNPDETARFGRRLSSRPLEGTSQETAPPGTPAIHAQILRR